MNEPDREPLILQRLGQILFVAQVASDKARAVICKHCIYALTRALRALVTIAENAYAMTLVLVVEIISSTAAVSVIRENESVTAHTLQHGQALFDLRQQYILSSYGNSFALRENQLRDECASDLEELRVEGRARKDPVLHFGDLELNPALDLFFRSLCRGEFVNLLDASRYARFEKYEALVKINQFPFQLPDDSYPFRLNHSFLLVMSNLPGAST